MKTLKDFNLKNKLVLLRSDLNCDVLGKKIIPTEKIKKSAETINFLKKKGARIVVLAHQGNPHKLDFVSLRQHAKFLNKFAKIKFVEDVCGKFAIEKIKKLKSGEALLLENVRFSKDEFYPRKKGNELLKNLAPLFDLFVNDSFSVSHRNHTSIVGFAKKIPSCAGPLVVKELDALKKISKKRCLYILGGAKLDSNIKLLGKNKIIATGLFDQLCLIARGKDLGMQNRLIKKIGLFKEGFEKTKLKLKGKLKNVETSIDFAVLKNGKRVEYDLEDFPMNYAIKDIGEKTIQKHLKEIKKAKAIYMRGDVGIAMEKKFSRGTLELLRAVGDSKAFSIIGGGSLNDVIKKYKIQKNKFNHVSLSGGALSNFFAGEKLPGLKVLGDYKK
ncbi:MAG: phosphoglycerate kinase [Candidatus Pacearchaeota archaeon]|jgi:phosphoglycerate kinase